MRKNGIALILAWPSTYCKQSGAWYDSLMNFLGFSKNNYYKVGHAAIILIHKQKKSAYYFDFGRYHTPFKKGRVRSVKTDSELYIKTKAKFLKNKLVNYKEFLKELQSREVFHGEGVLHASLTEINFEKSFALANKLQEESPIIYGPFIPQGSNCSRFVFKVVYAGINNIWDKFKLRFLVPFTPTPISNVRAFKNFIKIAKPKFEPEFEPPKLNAHLLEKTIPSVIRHKNIPLSAQWLSGEGYGSWFYLHKRKKNIEIVRYSPEGKIECRGFFEGNPEILKQNYRVVYLSTCAAVRIVINNKKITLSRKKIMFTKSQIYTKRLKYIAKLETVLS